MNPKEDLFQFKSADIPTSSGCYLYYDENNDLLYIGKAKNLRKRVSSYFQKDHDNPRLKVLVSKIKHIETRLVNTEVEALLLEKNLVQTLHPRYNIRLKDDKNWVYLRITKEERPKMEIVRRMIKDGSTYIGPKTASKPFRNSVRFCQKYFRIEMVKESQNYYPHMAQGMKLNDTDYQANIEAMKRFLRGHTKDVVKELTERMMTFAKDQNFEAAAKLRDTIESIQVSNLKQKVSFTDFGNRDFIHYVLENQTAYVVRLVFRDGELRDQSELQVKTADFEDPQTFWEHLLLQFYEKVTDPPKEIWLPLELENQVILEQLFSEHFFGGLKVSLNCPKMGEKKQVLEIALKNAEQFRDKAVLADMSKAENFSKALPELAEVLNLSAPPRRLECYDVSHHQGDSTVASMVVFIDGEPQNSEYRKFNIKSLTPGKIDDFASMKEVLRRRFHRSTKAEVKENLTLTLVETYDDWTTYHDIAEKEVFKAHNPEIEYNRDHPDLKLDTINAYLIKNGNSTVGVCLLRDLTKTRLQISVLGITSENQKQGFGKQALKLIEAKGLENNQKSVVLNAHPTTLDFYKKSNYEENFWKGNSKSSDNIPIGKKLKAPKEEKWEIPDLVVIDGGKGQLSSVMAAIKEFSTETLDGFNPENQIISLAKREEQIFRPGQPSPIELPWNSAALKLLQRARDEAHRFAINFGRQKRDKNRQKSILDDIPGIGQKTKKDLMKKFESVGGIREATNEQLTEVVSQKQLEALRRAL